jgi:endonuclease YncB( thermonuclease family)
MRSSAHVAALVILALTACSIQAADVVGIPHITDADTVEINATKIRLEGIDAPETDQLCLNAKGERWTCGIEARDRLIERAAGKMWTCHVHGNDRYKRALGTCAVGGDNIQQWMVVNGWALSFVRYSHQYDPDQETARKMKAGLWGGAFIAPWDWRNHGKRTAILGATSVPANAQAILLSAASAAGAPSTDCTIKGNADRAGQCIFHRPGGRHYSSLNMATKGKRWFCSAEEAEAAGCRASRN